MGRVDDIEQLYTEHIRKAVDLAFFLTRSERVAEDVAHDAFLRCVSRIGSLRSREQFPQYFHKAVVRGVIDESRASARRAEREYRYEAAGFHATGPTDTQIATRVDMVVALASLTKRQGAAVVLKYWLDYSERDIATFLQCREGTVKSSLSRALVTLKGVLDVG
jgi:RNA polymerase sigma factor (sigma-70 family)